MINPFTNCTTSLEEQKGEWVYRKRKGRLLEKCVRFCVIKYLVIFGVIKWWHVKYELESN